MTQLAQNNSPTLNRSISTERSREELFRDALQGEQVQSIDRYQVYTDFNENETVVFIHDPSGQDRHKYIFAETDDHTYIVAAPMEWTYFHREILARVRQAAEERPYCPGGGYIEINDDGSLWVGRSSGDFGVGDHARAKEAFEKAVFNSAEIDN